MRKFLILAAISFQVFVLAYMAVKKEMIYYTGTPVYIATTPLDPNDPFRGEFVRLQYDLSFVPTNYWSHSLSTQFIGNQSKRSLQVYAVLNRSDHNRVELEQLTDVKPDTGLFLRGQSDVRYHSASQPLSVNYGIESYFVQQSRGHELETRREKDGYQFPLDMEVLIASDGDSVLRSHRWGDLGIKIKRTLSPRDENNPRRRLLSVEVSLLNGSDHPIAIIDLPNGRSFRLVPASRPFSPDNEYHWIHETDPQPTATAADVHLLQPGEHYEFLVLLESNFWQVEKEGEPPKQIGDLEGWNQSFRLVYTPPTSEGSRGLPHEEAIWHDTVKSRAFSNVGSD